MPLSLKPGKRQKTVSLKLMVVDDEPAVLDLIKSRIEPMGCEIQAMEDSRAAAERLETVKFDRALVDVVMRTSTGLI